LLTGSVSNLTEKLPIPEIPLNYRDKAYDKPINRYSRGLSFGGWIDDEHILVYDLYDIWQIDLEYPRLSVNLTNGYGRRNKIQFRVTPGINIKPLTINSSIILSSFNKRDKNAGFYQIQVNKNTNPKLLSLGPYVFDPYLDGFSEVKARDTEAYIVRRESCTESPNYFWTTDLTNFVPVSNVHPEKDFNWPISELVHFKTVDNRIEEAIIYKPLDFDQRKKYPVIFYYYETKSDNLNKYDPPANIFDNFSVSWFVSQGYIVITPDIHYKIGEPGLSAFNSVVGAAIYAKQFSWIDSKKMGLYGHSFGGYETNFIVSHSNIFSAACSSSGASNLISRYGSLSGDGSSQQERSEQSQTRIGASLWEKPGLYIKNSPIFFVDNVNTPLLTVANKNDGNVPFAQGLEWFLALRRNGKRVWMLQYDNGYHNLSGKNYIDFFERVTQFFNHYLKCDFAPHWMLNGVPAKMKGISDGKKLDTSGLTPGPGLLKRNSN
jgi:dipeptidyl aminopeptidase/acylaminoacyl peptidase